jgi:hypothetical protein
MGVFLAFVVAVRPSAHAGEFVRTFTIPAEGDEHNLPRVDIVGNSLLVHRDWGTTIYDARTGARRVELRCPVLNEEDLYQGSCAGVPSRHLIVVPRTEGLDLFDRHGHFRRRIADGVPANGYRIGLAVRGRRILLAHLTGPPSALEIRLLDAGTGQVVRSFVHPDLGPLPYGINLAFAGRKIVVSARSLGRVWAFSAATGRLLWSRTGDGLGTSLASLGPDVVVGTAAVRLSGRTGEVKQTYLDPSPAPSGRFGHSLAATRDIVAVADSGFRASEGPGGAVHLYDASTGALEATLEHPPEAAHEPFGTALAIGGRSLAVASLNLGGDGAIWGFVR